MLFLAVTLAPTLFVAGCGLQSFPFSHSLILIAPARPDAWNDAADVKYSVYWLDPEGREQTARITESEKLGITVARGIPQLIRLEPELIIEGEGGTCRGKVSFPAGALYPDDLTDTPVSVFGAVAPFSSESLPFGEAESIEADWRSGYIARLALELERRGHDPFSFAMGRMRVDALTRVADPWNLPPGEVATALVGGNFRADNFREPAKFPVELPGPGPWFPDSPFGRFTGAGGSLRTELSAGLHAFHGRSGSLWVVVDSEGGSSWVRLPDGIP